MTGRTARRKEILLRTLRPFLQSNRVRCNEQDSLEAFALETGPFLSNTQKGMMETKR